MVVGILCGCLMVGIGGDGCLKIGVWWWVFCVGVWWWVFVVGGGGGGVVVAMVIGCFAMVNPWIGMGIKNKK